MDAIANLYPTRKGQKCYWVLVRPVTYQSGARGFRHDELNATNVFEVDAAKAAAERYLGGPVEWTPVGQGFRAFATAA